MKNFMCGVFILSMSMFAALAFAAETRINPTPAELKKMSTFLSNFTELGFMNFDVEAGGSDELLHMASPGAAPDLIRFGIRHNYVNNYKSRIFQCQIKDCPHGSLTIDGEYVAESVKKYFDLDLKNKSVTGSDPPYYYSGQLYHFEGADGEATYYADVKEVFQTDRGHLRMTGEIYNADEVKDRPATFVATARPHKFGGKDTWAILSLAMKWND